MRSVRPLPTRAHIVRRTSGTVVALAMAATLAATMASCVTTPCPPNPSFPLSDQEATADLERMKAQPVAVDRPVVFVAGIGEPGISSGSIMRTLEATIAGPMAEVHFFDETTFDGARQKLLKEVAAALGTDIDHLPEVDVVAFSMGGLVARHAAIPDPVGRRLPVRRMFTICTPHEGARMGAFPIGTPQSDDMNQTSDFLERLRCEKRPYAMVCYARLDDATVGEEFAAPAGEALWWVPTPSGEYSHMHAFTDRRILADIARRLRGEAPFSTLPAAPLPD